MKYRRKHISKQEGSVSKLKWPIQLSAVGAGVACPKIQSKLFSGERTSPLQTKRQHYPRFDTPRPYILTCNHIPADPTCISVRLSDKLYTVDYQPGFC